MARKINPIKIEPLSWNHPYGVYNVYITLYQIRKLPSWVTKNLDVYLDDDAKHALWRIDAKDELEALMRFRRLWDALSVLHKDKK